MLVGQLDTLRSRVDPVDLSESEAPQALAEEAGTAPDVQRTQSRQSLVVALIWPLEMLDKLSPEKTDAQLVEFVQLLLRAVWRPPVIQTRIELDFLVPHARGKPSSTC